MTTAASAYVTANARFWRDTARVFCPLVAAIIIPGLIAWLAHDAGTPWLAAASAFIAVAAFGIFWWAALAWAFAYTITKPRRDRLRALGL